MKTYLGFENSNKVSDRSPDYLISSTLEEGQQTIGIMYRSESRKGVEYLKIMMDGEDGSPETRKTYFGFMNKYKKNNNDPDWNLYIPKNKENEKRKPVGAIFEDTDKDGNLSFRIVFLDDNDGNKSGGVDANKNKS